MHVEREGRWELIVALGASCKPYSLGWWVAVAVEKEEKVAAFKVGKKGNTKAD